VCVCVREWVVGRVCVCDMGGGPRVEKGCGETPHCYHLFGLFVVAFYFHFFTLVARTQRSIFFSL